MNTFAPATILSHLQSVTESLFEELSESRPMRTLREYLEKRALLAAVRAAQHDTVPPLVIGDLTARLPIVQGGMGVGISLSGLAAAVANAGGIGVIAANAIGMLEKDYFRDGRAANLRALRSEIRAARAATDGVIGVNIMVAVADFHELLEVAIEERVDVIFMGAGLPIKGLPVDRIRAAGVKIAPIVSSVRAVEMIFRMWRKLYDDAPDAVVFEGPKAGGHLGFTAEQIDDPAFQLEAIVPQIAAALEPFATEAGRSIPLIAGGGIFSGADMHRALELGAAGVQMGTRFVATEECDADPAFKQAYVHATAEDIGLIHSPVGMPGRAIRNAFITDAEAGQRPKFRCAWQCLASCKADDANYCISIALNNARRGNLRQGFVFAGSNAYRVTAIVPVAELMAELELEYRLVAAGAEPVSEAVPLNWMTSVLETVETLRDQHRRAGAAVRAAANAYEQALASQLNRARDAAARLNRTREAAAAHLHELGEAYQQALNASRALQFQLTERLSACWAVMAG
jgi:nitronate monooxygenase